MATRELKDATQRASESEYGVAILAPDGGTGPATVVQGDDARLEAAADLATHLADSSAAHAAAAIGFTPTGTIAATDAQAAIAEAASEAATATGTVASDLAAHLADTTGAHAATAIAFTPNGSIAATNVQAAIQEVRDEAGAGGPLNFVGTSDPTVNDDSGDGYSVESRWINTATDTEFVCTDDSAGAAVWRRTTPGTGGTDAADIDYDPTASGLAATDVQAALDEVAALGGGGNYTRLDQVVVGVGGAASLPLPTIPGTYEELRITIAPARGSTAALTVDLLLQANGDTGANYDSQRHFSYGGNNAAGDEDPAATSARVGNIVGASAPAGSASIVEISIPGYARTVFHKQMRASGGHRYDTADAQIVTAVGNWRDTAAITDLLLFLGAGDFVAGTVVTLYGIG